MTRFPLFLLILITLSGLLAANETAAYYLLKGDSAYLAFDHPLAKENFSRALELAPESYEAAWKLSRAMVDIGEGLEKKDERKHNYLEAKAAAEKAVAINPEGAKGYLFLSIALGRVALDAGAKERVRLSKDIKAAVDRSLELDPNDDIAWHVLGRWHRKIATLNWMERNFANIFLGGVPKEASVEKAAECFEKAIAIKPMAIAHHLELGITYEELKEKEKAAAEYRKVLDLPVSDSDDPGYKAVAREQLKKLE